MRVLGITGGIATGKSTVTQMLADLGAPTVSADALAHDLLAPGTVTTRAVLDVFPGCADPSDGARLTVDRRALGKIVFADPAARARLEALTHPAIIAALQDQIAAWRVCDQAPAAAAEIPLLFEADLVSLPDRVIVVACGEAVQIARMRARIGVSEEEARERLSAQWPLAEKTAWADVVITTDSDLEDTRRQVEALWKTL
jgi:dephospho-CoA kinase